MRFARSPIAWVADLEPVREREARGLEDLLRRRHEEAAVAGVVGVRLEERGPARAEGAVGIELHRAHGQHAAARAPTSGRPSAFIVAKPAGHHVEPHAQPPGRGRAAVELDHRRARAPASVRLVTPFARHSSIASSSARASSSAGARRRLDERLRVVDEDAGRARRPRRGSARRPPGAVVARVTPRRAIARAFASDGVAVGALEDDGVVGRDGARAPRASGKPRTAPGAGAAHLPSCQPRPRTHSPGRRPLTAAATRATTSSKRAGADEVDVEARRSRCRGGARGRRRSRARRSGRRGRGRASSDPTRGATRRSLPDGDDAAVAHGHGLGARPPRRRRCARRRRGARGRPAAPRPRRSGARSTSGRERGSASAVEREAPTYAGDEQDVGRARWESSAARRLPS